MSTVARVKGPFISFKMEDRKTGIKTDIWCVWNTLGGIFLGRVEWFNHWRKYTFNPAGSIVLDEFCMREIADFCQSETEKRRKGKRSFDE